MSTSFFSSRKPGKIISLFCGQPKLIFDDVVYQIAIIVEIYSSITVH